LGVTDIYVAIAVLLAACGAWLLWDKRRLERSVQTLRHLLDERTTELETATLQLQRLSTADSLTALPNHEQFLECVEREWHRAEREAAPLSLIFVDIDHFHAYNREFGRDAGDACLKRIGEALEGAATRAADLVARYHGDEFAIVLPSTNAAGGLCVAEKARRSVEALQVPASQQAGGAFVTVSVSLASVVPNTQSEWEELDLIKIATQALREARAQGGNRVCRASPDVSPAADLPVPPVAINKWVNE